MESAQADRKHLPKAWRPEESANDHYSEDSGPTPVKARARVTNASTARGSQASGGFNAGTDNSPAGISPPQHLATV